VISKVFTAQIMVHNVADLYAWQAAVTFDPDVLVVVDVTPGDFLNVEFPFFVWSEDSSLGEGNVLLGSTLHGNVPGVSGTGTLASLEFGVIGEGSYELQLLTEASDQPMLLLYDSTGTEISDVSVTLET
jgi:hypothetical protein